MTSKISVIKGDITIQKVDAVINAANSSLMGGGGVDGAIHRSGGPSILEECMQITSTQGGCRTGEAVITSAGKLPARFVIHAVGPVWQGGGYNESQLLSNAYTNSLKLAFSRSLQSVAFPNISTGVYGYPKEAAAEIAIRCVKEFVIAHNLPERIIFVCFDEENFEIYQQLLKG
jgi:O-acetyl-ADP-ribose deacetylase